MAQDPNLYAEPNVDSVVKSLRKYMLRCQNTSLARHGTFRRGFSNCAGSLTDRRFDLANVHRA